MDNSDPEKKYYYWAGFAPGMYGMTTPWGVYTVSQVFVPAAYEAVRLFILKKRVPFRLTDLVAGRRYRGLCFDFLTRIARWLSADYIGKPGDMEPGDPITHCWISGRPRKRVHGDDTGHQHSHRRKGCSLF